MTSASGVSRTRTVVVALAVAPAAILVASVAWQLANPRSGAITQASAAVGVRITMKVTGHTQGLFKGDDNGTTRGGANLITLNGDVKQYTGGTDVLEDDSFVFRKVEQQDLIAHTDFIDNFTAIT